MQCLILAGGLGTRINAISAGQPKSLIPVLGRPFIDYQLSWLARQGVAGVVLALGAGAALIRDFVDEGRQWGLSVSTLEDGPHPLGTAGAIRKAVELELLGDSFFVLYGDSYLDVDLKAVWAQHQKSKRPVMTVFHNTGNWDASNVLMAGGKLSLFEKNRPDAAELGMEYIDYGISVLTKSTITRHVPPHQNADLADLFHQLSLSGDLDAFEAHNRFYEIGSPQGHADLEAHLSDQARRDD